MSHLTFLSHILYNSTLMRKHSVSDIKSDVNNQNSKTLALSLIECCSTCVDYVMYNIYFAIYSVPLRPDTVHGKGAGTTKRTTVLTVPR